ncbi:hypothetical protein POUND7_001968, partial [Theobroma cacao]
VDGKMPRSDQVRTSAIVPNSSLSLFGGTSQESPELIGVHDCWSCDESGEESHQD